jgi:hypothetical protein
MFTDPHLSDHQQLPRCAPRSPIRSSTARSARRHRMPSDCRCTKSAAASTRRSDSVAGPRHVSPSAEPRDPHGALGAGDGRLQAELAELENVQAHLRAGRGEAALELLDTRSDGGTLLEEERMASEVLAACQAGQRDRARRAALAFLARAPGSLLANQVRNSCVFAEESEAPVTSRH